MMFHFKMQRNKRQKIFPHLSPLYVHILFEIVSTALFTFGYLFLGTFLIECLSFGSANLKLFFHDHSCSDAVTTFFVHIGTLGLYGWLPSIVAAVYIPYVALDMSMNLHRSLSVNDIYFASACCTVGSIFFWNVGSVIDLYKLSTYDFYCSGSRLSLILGISNSFNVI